MFSLVFDMLLPNRLVAAGLVCLYSECLMHRIGVKAIRSVIGFSGNCLIWGEGMELDARSAPETDGVGVWNDDLGLPPKLGRRVEPRFLEQLVGDARSIPLPVRAADVVITSPPYWLKRDYEFENQIGQEPTADAYVANLIECLNDWQRVLPDWGSIFVNIGDTYHRGSLAGTPARLEVAAQDAGWIVRNRIVWVKEGGMPDPAKDRLKNRHEFIFHFVRKRRYYYDQFGYSEKYGNGTGPSDVWTIGLRRNMSKHLAPFPEELVDRLLTLACPREVCVDCGQPRKRIVRRTANLDPSRPQARRAMELVAEKGLTEDHIAAIQATGISDAGKAMRTQTGTGKNSETVKRLAAEAKEALGGYFREYTFAKRETAGWTDCGCSGPFRPGVVLDPFVGTGTTLRAADDARLSAYGMDLAPSTESNRNAPRDKRD